MGYPVDHPLICLVPGLPKERDLWDGSHDRDERSDVRWPIDQSTELNHVNSQRDTQKDVLYVHPLKPHNLAPFLPSGCVTIAIEHGHKKLVSFSFRIVILHSFSYSE